MEDQKNFKKIVPENLQNFLQENKIEFSFLQHPPLRTCADAQKFRPVKGLACKNLFLRDKGGKHFLYTLAAEDTADLKFLREKLGCRKLSLASAEELKEYLGLVPGGVSPFGLINDPEEKVLFCLHQKVLAAEIVNFHPNVNIATLTLTQEMFQKFLRALKRPYLLI